MRALLLFTCGCLACPGAAMGADVERAIIKLDAERTIGDVPAYLYGQFFGQDETCVYNGLWAEMVLDRKFYYPVGEAGLSPWFAAGNGLVRMESAVTCGDAMAVCLSEGGALQQRGITLAARGYSGYFYAACVDCEEAEVTVTLRSTGASRTVRVPVSGSALAKYEYRIDFPADTLYGFYEISATRGSCVLDSLSMMPDDNIGGLRADTMALLKELNATVYRWPGGNFVSGYNWKDGVGDIDFRPPMRNEHYMGLASSFASDEQRLVNDKARLAYLGFYGGIEPNDFGTDEFMTFCEYLGADVMMVVNSGLGTAEDAADLVEYLNGSIDTEYGARRAENGRAEPYAVKLFGIGNEMFGEWQLGNMSIEEYAPRHNEFAAAMRLRDPSIKIIGVGENWGDQGIWSKRMLIECADSLDYIDEHLYSFRQEKDVAAHARGVEENLNGRIARHRLLLGTYPQAAHVGMLLMEYAYNSATVPSRLKDALGIGVFMNVMIKNADVVRGAAYSETINMTQGCVTTTDTEAVMQGAGYVLAMYRRLMYGTAVQCEYTALRYLSVSAAVDEETGRVALAVVNPSIKAIDILCEALADRSFVRHSIVGDSPDSSNTPQHQSIREISEPDSWVLPPYSLSILVFD